MEHTEFETREENPKPVPRELRAALMLCFSELPWKLPCFWRKIHFPSGWNFSILTKPGAHLTLRSMVQPSPTLPMENAFRCCPLEAGWAAVSDKPSVCNCQPWVAPPNVTRGCQCPFVLCLHPQVFLLSCLGCPDDHQLLVFRSSGYALWCALLVCCTSASLHPLEAFMSASIFYLQLC